jgi:PAS domain S-box-containing protein
MTTGRRRREMPESKFQRSTALAATAGIAFALAYVSLLAPTGDATVPPIWLPNAFVLAVLLASHGRRWLERSIGGGLAIGVANIAAGVAPSLAIGLSACNIAEYLGAATLIVRWIGRRPDLSRPSIVAKYAAASAIAAAISGAAATAVIWADTGALKLHDAIVWALADFSGLLVVTPCLLALWQDRSAARELLRRDAWALAAVLATSLIVFLQHAYPLLFLVPAALSLIALRSRLAVVSAGLLGSLAIAAVCTIQGNGPFSLVEGPMEQHILGLQLFIAVTFLVSLPITAQADRERGLKAQLAHALNAAVDDARKVHMAQAVAEIGYWRYDVPTGEVSWSDELYRIMDRDRSQPVTLSLALEAVHPDDRQRRDENFSAWLAGDAAFDQGVYRIVQPSGTVRHVHGRAVMERDEAGEVTAVFGVIQDTTEAVLAQNEKQRAEARFRLMAESARDMFIRADLSGRLTYISPSCRLLGYEPEELIGSDGSDLLHPDDVELYKANGAQFVRDGYAAGQFMRRHRYRCKDGSYRWLEGIPAYVRDDDGNPIEVVNVFRDVTERMTLEAELASSEERYRRLADNSGDIVATFDLATNFTYLSPAVERVLGYKPDELVGKSTSTIMHEDDFERSITEYGEHLASGKPEHQFNFEYRGIRKDGSEVWLLGSPRAIRDPNDGELVGFQDVVRDITERKRFEAELTTARAEAETAAHVKSEFLANMSHELRTPLTSIVGFTRLVNEQQDLSPLSRDYVNRVENASRALLSVVNDVLDFSKLEAGQITFKPEPTNLLGLMRSSLELFQPQAGAKDIDLLLDAESSEDIAVAIDADRMRQVLLNLISNAVKFTQEGRVTLRVRYDHQKQWMKVEVQDSGAGIDSEGQARLFKRFSQVDGSLTRTHGGTGLGLAICKGIVEAMHGEIGVTSEPGRGSCFWFETPAPKIDAAAVARSDDASAISAAGIRVLVVDDHPANRELASLFLAGLGAEIAEASDGEEAAAMAASWPYDVILMDMRMPKLDGPEALRRIRANRGPNAATPILAFTAEVGFDVAGQMMNLGFQGVVSKPIDPEDLIRAIAQATTIPRNRTGEGHDDDSDRGRSLQHS